MCVCGLHARLAEAETEEEDEGEQQKKWKLSSPSAIVVVAEADSRYYTQPSLLSFRIACQASRAI